MDIPLTAREIPKPAIQAASVADGINANGLADGAIKIMLLTGTRGSIAEGD